MTVAVAEAPRSFTADQKNAIAVHSPARDTCVVAGPGSGKTTVLVEHFKELVAAGTDPLRILAITFTEKAAGNMRAKLAQAFEHDPVIRARLERAWVSTVHGFCGRLLRENAVYAGVDPEFVVADAREAWRLQQESMAAVMEELFARHPESVRALIRGLSSWEFEQAVLSAYDAMRGAGRRVTELEQFPAPAGVTVEQVAATLDALAKETLSNWSYQQKQYRAEILEAGARIVFAETPLDALRAVKDFNPSLQKCKRGTVAYDLVKRLREEEVKELTYSLITQYYRPQRELLIEILRRFDALYRERKRQAGLLDFADLEEFAVRLLETRPDVRTRLQEQFQQILMDEFQDTNGQQARLISLVRSPDRFYAVGDINQSIYGFRHAEPEGFRKYREDIEQSGAQLVQLMTNFRSRAEILRAVETIIAGAPGIEPHHLTPGKDFPPEPDGSPVVEAIAVSAADAGAALRLEAQWVARRIAELAAAGTAFEDIAVLVRNTEVIGEFTGAFDAAKIPYSVNCGRGFYDSREVVDLTHLLRVIANPRDEISLAAVLRSPLVGVSDESLFRLKLDGYNLGAALSALPDDAAGFDSADLENLVRFRDHLREWRARREYVTFDRLLAAAIDDSGYVPESAAALDKFLAEARSASGKVSLDEFVAELELVRKENPREADPPPDDSRNAVKVMTVHSAKGLEFPIVFVAALQKGVDTDPPVVCFSRHFGLGARWRNPGAKEEGRAGEKDDAFQHAIREELRTREEQESNRLLYVAMTRAERRLILTFSGNAKKLANWAQRVADQLSIDPAQPCTDITTHVTPEGLEWKLRVLVAAAPPELLPITDATQTNAKARAQTEWLEKPEITDQQDGNATVTALAEFARCPRRYELAHYLGFSGRKPKFRPEEDVERPLPADEFGTQVHEFLAGKTMAKPDAEALRLAGVFQSSALGKRASAAQRIEREFDFLLALNGLIIRGQIDLWFEDGGRIEIVDYKTDAISAADAPRRAQDYALQLRIYAIAIERLTGRMPHRAWLHFLRPNVAVEVDLAPSLLESPEQILAEFAEAQDRMEFPLREGEHCSRCPFFKGLCPAGIAGS